MNEHRDLDHIPSDDPPGADSSPMSELQRQAMAPVLMTPDKARRLRADHDADAKSISRQGKTELIGRARHLGIHVDRASKQELVSAILEAWYPLARLNEAIHVLHHGEYPNSACEWCQPAGIPVQVLPARPCREHGKPDCFCDYQPVTLADHTASAVERILGA